MNRKNLLMLLFVISCSTHAMAQTDYYYDDLGNKITITLNEDMVCLSIPTDCDKVNERICANVEILFSKTDEFFDIYFITRADLDKLTSQDFWIDDSKSVIITPSYYIENDEWGKVYGAAYSTPYLGVKLKKEDDKDLLNSYIEKYNLQITMHRKSMPLWYFLSVTPESEISPLECANEMFESGGFASSVPDFAYAGYGGYEPNAVRNLTISKSGAFSDTYNLQGRRMSENQSLQPGIYVKDGRKFMVK